MEAHKINARIAGIKGIKYHVFDNDPLGLVWSAPDENGCAFTINYITDNALNHGLVVGLIEKGWESSYVDKDPWLKSSMYGWKNKISAGNIKRTISIWNNDFNTATALAWIEEFGK